MSATDTDRFDERTEQILALWRELFEDDDVHADDNFFELGGDSLLALELTQILRDRMSLDLDIADFMSHATPTQMARYVTPYERKVGS